MRKRTSDYHRLRRLTVVVHVLLGRLSSVGMRESLELVSCLVGIHFFAESKQMKSGVRTDLIIHTLRKYELSLVSFLYLRVC
jgi:hypothetical protein